jgi:ATP-binding cassette subfamily B protein
LNILLDFSRRYLLPYWWWYVIGFALVYLTQWVAVSIVDQGKQGIDAAVASGDAATIAPFVYTIIGLGIAVIIVRTASRLMVFTPGRMIEYHVRNDYYSNLLYLQRDFFAHHQAGDLISRCSNDIGYIRAAYGFALLQVGNVAATFYLVMKAMLEIDRSTTFYVAIPLIVSFVIIQASINYMMKFWRLSNEQIGEMSSLCLSSFKGVSAVQNYHAEPAMERRFNAASRAFLNTHERLTLIRSLIMPMVQLVANLSIFAVLLIAGPQVISGSLTMGEILAFQGYINLITTPLLSLGWMMNVFNRAIPAMERLDEILKAKPNLPTPKPYTDAAADSWQILAKGMRFQFPKAAEDVEVPFKLQDVDLEITPGKVIGIVGPTGAGKTTLLESLMRMNPIQEDELFLNQQDAYFVDLDQFRPYFSFAPQKPLLFSTTLRRNLMMALPAEDWEREDTESKLLRGLDMAGFDLDPKQFPDGLETEVGEKGVMLSGGQRQRIALARALLRDARIFVLDDVLSAVDHETEKRIVSNIRSFAAGRALIIASHRVSAIQWADEILVLEDGVVSERGDHQSLLAKGGFYRKIYEYQAENSEAVA